MSALAGFLRERAMEDVRNMSVEERIRLALMLGEDDVRVFGAASGIDRAEAERRIAATRQSGRRFSAVAARS